MIGVRRLTQHGLALLCFFAVAVLYLRPIFAEGLFIAGDHPFYLAVTDQLNATLGGQGLVGWFGGDFGGFPVFSPFVPAPLPFLAIVALSKLTSLSIVFLYKGMVFLSFLFPACALWLILSRRFDVLAAFAASSLYLLLTYSLLQPLQGFWIHYLGLGMMLVLIHYADLWLRAEVTLGKLCALGLLMAFTALTDALTWPLLALFIPLTVFFSYRRHGLAGRSLALTVVVLLLSSAAIGGWVSLVVVDQSLWGMSHRKSGADLLQVLVRLPAWFVLPGGFEQITEDVIPAVRSGQFAQGALVVGRLIGEHLSELLVLALFLAGLVFFFRRPVAQRTNADPFLQYAVALLALFMLFLIGPWHFFEPTRHWSVIAPLRHDRFVLYVNVMLLIFATYALQEVWRRFPGLRRAAPITLLVTLIVLHGFRYSTYSDYLPLKTSSQSVIYEELAGVWGYVREHVDGSQSRVLYEELEGVGFLDGGYTNLTALSAGMTGVSSITTQQLKTHFSFRESPLSRQENLFGALPHVPDVMRDFNCSYLVVWHPMITHRLLQTGSFQKVYESEHRLFSVLRLADYQPEWIEFDQAVEQSRVVSVKEGHLIFRVHNAVPHNRARLKMNYHPSWSARINGQARAVTEREGMIEVNDLPQGEVEMEFRFRFSGWGFDRTDA